MNKLHHYLNNYNITGVVQQFNGQCLSRTGNVFYGKLNIIVFDRKLLNQIENRIYTDCCLSGFLPKLPNDEFMDEDFLLTLDSVYPFELIARQLNSMDDIVYFQVECVKDEVTQNTNVLVSKW